MNIDSIDVNNKIEKAVQKKSDIIILRSACLLGVIAAILISVTLKKFVAHKPVGMFSHIIICLMYFFLFLVNFFSNSVNGKINYCLYFMLYTSTAILMYFLYDSNFSQEYAWYLTLVIFSAIFIIKKINHLRIYLLSVFIITMTILTILEEPVVNRIYASTIITIFFILAFMYLKSSINTINIIKSNKEEIRKLAYYDYITKLPNRYFMSKYVNKLLEKEYSNRTIAIMFIDLDNFKNINDTLGHKFGDLLLESASQRLVACVGDDGTVFRYGGDEFVVILDRTDKNKCTIVGEKIVNEFSRNFQIYDRDFFTSASIGISLYPEDGKDLETLIKNADVTMYSVKKNRKNGFKFYNSDINKIATRKMELENALRKALDNNEFLLYYQPQYEIESGKIYGMEALIRWNHPEMGMISPEEFIPLAEETGLIIPIGEWIIKTACTQNKIWQDNGLIKVPVSINVSAHQLHDDNFLNVIKEELVITGLAPKYLTIEITESIMQDFWIVSNIVNELRNLGLRVAVDDFGTGYSSMEVIKNLKIDTLKIDPSFIKDIHTNENTLVILQMIINLGNSLGFNIIIEGIETKEQAILLKQMNCRIGQGYYYNKPLSVKQIENILE